MLKRIKSALLWPFKGQPPSWSSLGRLGQSRLLMLTTLMPFVGFLIIFNDQLVRLTTVSASALGIDQATATAITLRQLNYLYLSLLILGCASLLFRLQCPAEVRDHATLQAWIEGQSEHMSTAWRRSSFRAGLQRYHRATGGSGYSLEYPSFMASRLASMIEHLVLEANLPNEPEIREAFFMDDGRVATADAIKILRKREPEWLPSVRAVEDRLGGYEVDILALDYWCADHSASPNRRLIWHWYCLGFITLAVPTVSNIVAVLKVILLFR